jgi:hypothetical protein
MAPQKLGRNAWAQASKKLLVSSEIPIVDFVASFVETKSTYKQLKNNLIVFERLVVYSLYKYLYLI